VSYQVPVQLIRLWHSEYHIVLVIAYRDRLTRFGYELIEWIIKENSNGIIKVINQSEESTPMEEISKDILSIMNVYVSKINGLRKYRSSIKEELKSLGG
jgi:hypothetical protein